jgi:hypothetical protein
LREIAPRAVQAPQQGIEPTLHRFPVAALRPQGAQQFRHHRPIPEKVIGRCHFDVAAGRMAPRHG